MTQFGPTIEVFRKPVDLVTARTFADPPLNTIVLAKKGSRFVIEDGGWSAGSTGGGRQADGAYTIGFQPHHLSLKPTGPVPSRSAPSHRDRDHGFGELHPPAVRRCALGAAGAWHPDLRGRRDARGSSHSIPGTSWCSTSRVGRSRPISLPGRRRRRRRWRASNAVTSATLTAPIRSPTRTMRCARSITFSRTDGAYALLGPSGCGKDHIAQHHSGLLHPSEGRLKFDGRDVTDLSTQSATSRRCSSFRSSTTP